MIGKIFAADCPYCHTREVAFTIKSFAEAQADFHPSIEFQDTFALCGKCGRAVVMTLMTQGGRFGVAEIVKIAPSPPEPPQHLPANIKSFFIQAVDNLSQNWDAAGAMFRKVLDVALKDKFPKIEGNLKQRIDEAAKQQGLTPELAKWAHQIRFGGNEATHGENPLSQDDAKDLYDLAELVLRYLYTLPGMLERAKARREPKTPTQPSRRPPDIKRLR